MIKDRLNDKTISDRWINAHVVRLLVGLIKLYVLTLSLARLTIRSTYLHTGPHRTSCHRWKRPSVCSSTYQDSDMQRNCMSTCGYIRCDRWYLLNMTNGVSNAAFFYRIFILWEVLAGSYLVSKSLTSLCFLTTVYNWHQIYTRIYVSLRYVNNHWETAVTKKSVVFVPLYTLCGKVQNCTESLQVMYIVTKKCL